MDVDLLREFDRHYDSCTHMRISVFGNIQGVGFRPYAFKLASSLNLCGYVANTSSCALIYLQKHSNCKEFITKIARISGDTNISVESISIDYVADSEVFSDFRILDSVINQDCAIRLKLPLDYKICDECLSDMNDRESRFYNYPFVSCVNCGSRYSILRNLPYHRDNTSMKDFALCASCLRDYLDPYNRRFYAEQISCNDCKIDVSLSRIGASGAAVLKDDPLTTLAMALNNNEVAIFKGLCGYAYIANAKSSEAIRKLRALKLRPHKPFAIMAAPDRVRALAILDSDMINLLSSKEAPIIIARKAKSYDLCDEVGALDTIGAMIPYSPMLILLFRILGEESALVYTSANKKGAMIAKDLRELDSSFIIDTLKDFNQDSILALEYNRDILHRLDDSVISCLNSKQSECELKSSMHIIKDGFRAIRISRGFAPMNMSFKNLRLDIPTLAFGAMQKSSISFGMGNVIATSSYMGDLFSVDNVDNFLRNVEFFTDIYGRAQAFVIDAHSGYESSKIAYELAGDNIPIIKTLHHHAHLNALLLESGMSSALGVIFDGSGFGADGSVWGGEFLSGNFRDFDRRMYFKPFRILGGESYVRDSKRLLLSYAMTNNIEPIISFMRDLYDPNEMRALEIMHANSLNSPLTSSVGRLFDIVAFALGLNSLSYAEQSGEIIATLADRALGFEARSEALDSLLDFGFKESFKRARGMESGFFDDRYFRDLDMDSRTFNPYPFDICNEEIDISDCIRSIFLDSARGLDRRYIALRFIDTIAFCILEAVDRLGADCAMFGGGVFGNHVLCNRIRLLFDARRIRYFFPKLPCNDWAISIGQIARLSAL